MKKSLILLFFTMNLYCQNIKIIDFFLQVKNSLDINLSDFDTIKTANYFNFQRFDTVNCYNCPTQRIKITYLKDKILNVRGLKNIFGKHFEITYLTEDGEIKAYQINFKSDDGKSNNYSEGFLININKTNRTFFISVEDFDKYGFTAESIVNIVELDNNLFPLTIISLENGKVINCSKIIKLNEKFYYLVYYQSNDNKYLVDNLKFSDLFFLCEHSNFIDKSDRRKDVLLEIPYIDFLFLITVAN